MKKSKPTEASEREDGVDLISNLPDPILLSILSCIPSTEEVIRTSVLSTRWRYLWTSIPSINIDDSRDLKPLIKFERNKFREFVYWVLANRSLNLDTFRLCCIFYYNALTLGRWIHIAVTRNVKKLDLTLCPKKKSEIVEVPHCLVTCGSLEELRLFLFRRRLRFPNFTGLSSLRVLRLSNVEFELYRIYLVENFLKSCPLLEELSLLDCSANNEDLRISCPNLKDLRIRYRGKLGSEDYNMCDRLEISCPKLVFLMISGEVAGVISFENLDSLKEVVMHPSELTDWERPLVNGFAGFSSVELMSINLYCIAMCYYPPEDVPVSLPNLKTLELTTGVFDMDDLIQFLICFPHLESLNLVITQVDQLEKWNLDDIETMRILTRHLKFVEILGFDGGERTLAVARLLLEHGNELEYMAFLWPKDAEYHEKSMEAMKEVSKFHKASSIVEPKFIIQPPVTREMLETD